MSRGVDRSAFKHHLWGRSPFLDMCVLNLAEVDTSTFQGQMMHRIIRESIQWARDQPEDQPRIIKTHLPLNMLPPNLLNTAKGKKNRPRNKGWYVVALKFFLLLLDRKSG